MKAAPQVHSNLALNLRTLVDPLQPDEFLTSHWRKSFCHLQGSPNRFSAFLSWDLLNRIIEQNRLEPPRLKLFRAGNVIQATEFIDYEERANTRIPRISVKKLNRQIQQGATLVLNEVHPLHGPLTELVESLERFFGVPVGINAYAGFGTEHGLSAHCDDHEVIVLQVAGSKRWNLYGISDPPGILSKNAPPRVIWNKLLCAGDFLYVPRGCWHVAMPVNEPSLHLTISISNPTIIDLFGWLVADLRLSEAGHVDVSRLGDVEENERFIEFAKQVLLDRLSGDVLDRYFRASDSTRRPLTHLSLPWSAISGESLGRGDDVCYHLIGRRNLNLNDMEQPGAIEFFYNQGQWRFPNSMRVVLEALNDGQSHSVNELVNLNGEGPDEPTVRTFLSMLLAEGLIAVTPKRSF